MYNTVLFITHVLFCIMYYGSLGKESRDAHEDATIGTALAHTPAHTTMRAMIIYAEIATDGTSVPGTAISRSPQ